MILTVFGPRSIYFVGNHHSSPCSEDAPVPEQSSADISGNVAMLRKNKGLCDLTVKRRVKENRRHILCDHEDAGVYDEQRLIVLQGFDLFLQQFRSGIVQELFLSHQLIIPTNNTVLLLQMHLDQ